MKKYVVIFLALAITLSTSLTGCKNDPASSDSSVVSTADSTAESSSKVSTTAATTATTAATVSGSDTSSNTGDNTASSDSDSGSTADTTAATASTGSSGIVTTITSSGAAGVSTNASPTALDPYLLAQYSGSTCTEIAPTEKSDTRTFTSDTNWYNDTGVTMNSNSITVSCKDTAVAVNTQQFLGNVWTVGASFCPITTYDTRSDRVPVCTRLAIFNSSQVELFLLTISVLQGGAEDGSNQVSVDLQMQSNGSWRSLCATDDWITTNSTVFYFQISYDSASADNKVSCKVVGNEGAILEKTSPALKAITTLASTACVSGLEVYAACSEFFYWRIESNASQSITFPGVPVA